MRVVEELPHRVREIEHTWIPMPDGSRLAARIWLPDDALERPVPAILEYIPYGKREGTRERDEPMHRYFAGHGYAAVRVDIRGSGESDGFLRDEYLEREQLDGVEVIRWIAEQPWSTGRVGMMGKSWGGFNSLQVAALAPPELAAVITVCSTDDRYADDAHYMGGCLLTENLIWGSVLFTLNAIPPDPALLGQRWRELWLERIARADLYPEKWLRHPTRDGYWQGGSVCEDFDRIQCPVFAVGGWADGYTNAVPRLLAGLSVPRRGLIGPWAHVYPHDGVPGPAIGFLQEALRWWDRWLREDGRSGGEDEPLLRAWMQESVPPTDTYTERPGRWVAEREWPSTRIRGERWYLDGTGFGRRPHEGVVRTIRSPQTVGLAAGSWCGFGVDGEAPTDQREDDAGSITFDSATLEERTEILGAPVLSLDLFVDRPAAFVAARLNDVRPDGSVTRVTYGLLNLAHRNGHESPEAMVPGRRTRVHVRLNDVAHAFPPGHRIRIALSTSYWPVAWPSFEAVTLGIHTGESFLVLPTRPPDPADAQLRPFEPPEAAPPMAQSDLEKGGIERRVTRDPVSGEHTYMTRVDWDEQGDPPASRVEAIDLTTGHGIEECFRIRPDDPLSARAEIRQRAIHRRGDWSTRVETWMRLTSDAASFRLEASVVAHESGHEVARRSWDRRIPRLIP